MSRFKQQPPKDEAEDRTESSAAPTRIVRLPETLEHATADLPAGETAPAADASDPDLPDTKVNELGRANFGEHLESVLKAAEDAADRLLEDARMRAIAIRDGAERDASSRVEVAEATAARLTEESETAHAEALAAAERVRAAAEKDAADQRAEAEAFAAKLRADAERDAASFAQQTQARHEELLNDTSLAEDRLRRLVGGLREVADRLDGLVSPTEDEEQREPIAGVLHEQEPTTLAETLDPSQRG